MAAIPAPPLSFLFDGPADAAWTLALAHGAGAPMDSAFLVDFAAGLAERGVRVARFEFPYMRRRRTTGQKRPPDRPAVLLDAWREAIAELRGGRLAIGGKSLGGRIASMVADECEVDGLVCLGYPFHAPGRPEKPRVDHLRDLRTPALICQGTRDPFGKPDEIDGYELSPAIHVAYVEDGDHSLAPRKSSGRTAAQNLDQAIDDTARFLRRITP